ncbi:MAG: Holliday junction branch migration protein RuvA [Candidatus Nephrothrix sp. EaCA]|nr:MAG: Holliday junction branch migration protein RuvA [Candidatus Nephrothrix sp. EaCA]
MIAFLRGKLVRKEPARVLMEVSGVGYEVHISLHTYSAIKDSGELRLETYLHIREEAHVLFGFASEAEKEMFLCLISVNGIGPSTALLALSYLSPSELRNAIVQEETAKLQAVKGIGGKTAQRMILELKDKLKREGGDWESKTTPRNTARAEALSALITLGVNKTTAEKSVDAVLSRNPSAGAEEVIKQAFKLI